MFKQYFGRQPQIYNTNFPDTTGKSTLPEVGCNVEIWQDVLRGLEEKPLLHDVFDRIKGPAVGDIFANFVGRYNSASTPYDRIFRT